MNDNPARALAGEIERLARDGHYRPDEWLRFLVQDVLAGFGKTLEQPWDAYRQERLFGLAKRYGALVGENPWRDILGGAYMDLGSHGQHKWLAQYFTPQTIADCIAQITFHDLDLDEEPANGFIRVMEPASGAGVMLLAAGGLIATRHGPQALRRCSFTAVDLDGLCAGMTACQMLANGTLHGAMGELVVYQGNTLGPDSELDVVVHRVATPRFERAEPAPEILPAKAPARIAAIRQAAVAAGQQMSLFGADELPVSAVPERRRRRA